MSEQTQAPVAEQLDPKTTFVAMSLEDAQSIANTVSKLPWEAANPIMALLQKFQRVDLKSTEAPNAN